MLTGTLSRHVHYQWDFTEQSESEVNVDTHRWVTSGDGSYRDLYADQYGYTGGGSYSISYTDPLATSGSGLRQGSLSENGGYGYTGQYSIEWEWSPTHSESHATATSSASSWGTYDYQSSASA